MTDTLRRIAVLPQDLDEARAANRRLGEQIAVEGETVTWSCSCMTDPSSSCTHAVATVLATTGIGD